MKGEITGLKENIKDLMSELKSEKEDKTRIIETFTKEINDLKSLSKNETGALSTVS